MCMLCFLETNTANLHNHPSHPGLGARLFLQSGRRRSAAAGGCQISGFQPGGEHIVCWERKSKQIKV